MFTGDPTKAVVAPQGAGQPPAPASSEPAQGGTTPPAYVTREEAQAMAAEAAEAAYRKAQGLIDKTNSTTLKKVQGDLQALTKSLELQRQAGFQISPEQEASLRNQVISRALSEPESTPPPDGQPAAQTGSPAAQPGSQDGEWDAIVAAVNKMCANIERKAGVTLSEEEVKGIEHVVDPEDYVEAFRQLVTAKKAQPPTQPNQPTRAPTNLGAMGAHNPNPIAHITDPATLIAMGLGRK